MDIRNNELEKASNATKGSKNNTIKEIIEIRTIDIEFTLFTNDWFFFAWYTTIVWFNPNLEIMEITPAKAIQ